MNIKLKLAIDYYVGGAIHILLKPFVFTIGKILRRDHSLKHIEEITIIKMLGGGSLVIAYPSLLALKRKYPKLRLNLVTTIPIKHFAEILGLFDEIIVIREDSGLHLVIDSLRAIARLWRAKALVDLEIHSRLSSVFTLLTCARNRIGIYTDVSFWRKSLYTHLLFYNKYAPVYALYDQIVRLAGADPVDFESAKNEFASKIQRDPKAISTPDKVDIGIAPGCSDLGKERMLTAGQWLQVLQKRCSVQKNGVFHFIGSHQDKALAGAIISQLQALFPEIECHNRCGGTSLRDAIKLINQLDVLYCIDSGLIHFARLLGVKTISFWGPTDPSMRLRPDSHVQAETHYAALSCSPCVHIVSEAPCYGNNICMNASLQSENYTGERNPLWLA